MTLRKASIALGKIERGLLTPAERAALYVRAGEELDAAEGRQKLARAEHRYWRVRERFGDLGLLP